MAQQINLCSPILLTQKRYFSAHTMAISLGVFLVLGGVLAGAWVWNLQLAGANFSVTMQNQTQEIETLKVAIQRNKTNAAPVEQALQQQLQGRQQAVQEREKLLIALQDGLMAPGSAHSDRLLLLARTIPPQVWIGNVSATAQRFEISGYTLEPSALNGWVAILSASPLLRGLSLSDVSVDNADTSLANAAPVVGTPSAATSVTPAAGRPVWSFRLVNTQVVVPSVTGGKP